MTFKTVALTFGVLALAGAAGWYGVSHGLWPAKSSPEAGASKNAPAAGARAAPVSIAKAERRPMPVRFDTIGTVQPIVSVVIRTRVESQILDVGFEDGASVKQGDLLFKLDSRAIEAQIRQAEAQLSRSKAQLEQAQRDVKRNEQLAAREYASQQKLDDSRTAVETLSAQIRSDQAALDNLNVQLSYYTIRAPVSGRIGVAGLKAGNIAKTGDGTTPLATIIQLNPIYVAFAVPQRLLSEIQTAAAAGLASVLATPQGLQKGAQGKIAFIDNSVDAQSGTVTIRAIFENEDQLLWPGALCNVRLTISVEPDAVTVPSEAVQTGQNGPFVFVVVDNIARFRPVRVARAIDGLTVIASGLEGGESVVTDGQLLLNDGSKVEQKGQPGGQRPVGQPPPAPAREPGALPAAGADPPKAGAPARSPG